MSGGLKGKGTAVWKPLANLLYGLQFEITLASYKPLCPPAPPAIGDDTAECITPGWTFDCFLCNTDNPTETFWWHA